MVVQARKRQKKEPVPEVPPPTSRIGKIASLKRFEDKEYAKSLLHDVSRLVAPIMHENNFKVGLLCEMFPKSGNLLGLNVNGGSKIMLRLRYHSNSKSFLPMSDIIGTMLHELTHNVYGAHNDSFYKFLDSLKVRFEQIQYDPSSVKGYVCEENRLGGMFRDYTSIRQKRQERLGKGIYKAEVRRLGGNKNNGKDLKQVRILALEAAERRLRDSKACDEAQKAEAEPHDDELEIIENDRSVIDLTEIEGQEGEEREEQTQTPQSKTQPKTTSKTQPKTSKTQSKTTSTQSEPAQVDPKVEIIVID